MAWRVHSRPEPISYADINAWALASRVSLAAWQLAALTMIDEIFLKLANGPAPEAAMPATASNIRKMFQMLSMKKKK